LGTLKEKLRFSGAESESIPCFLMQITEATSFSQGPIKRESKQKLFCCKNLFSWELCAFHM